MSRGRNSRGIKGWAHDVVLPARAAMNKLHSVLLPRQWTFDRRCLQPKASVTAAASRRWCKSACATRSERVGVSAVMARKDSITWCLSLIEMPAR